MNEDQLGSGYWDREWWRNEYGREEGRNLHRG